jgi:hypothetical protein
MKPAQAKQPLSKKFNAQQWAWEFLRRNESYRLSWQLMSALNEAQWKLVADLERNTAEPDEETFSSLDLRFFDLKFLDLLSPEDTTVGSYLQRTSKIKGLPKTVDFKFNYMHTCRRYGLAFFVDPELQVDAALAKDMWFHELDSARMITYVPHMDDAYRSAPLRQPVNKIDRRQKSQPAYVGDSIPLMRGVDGKHYVQSESQWRRERLRNLEDFELEITFRADLPVEMQILQATEMLAEYQTQMIEAGFVADLKTRVTGYVFQEYVQILDLLSEGLNAIEIAQRLKSLSKRVNKVIDKRTGKLKDKTYFIDARESEKPPHSVLTQDTRKKMERAIALRDGGYRV